MCVLFTYGILQTNLFVFRHQWIFSNVAISWVSYGTIRRTSCNHIMSKRKHAVEVYLKTKSEILNEPANKSLSIRILAEKYGGSNSTIANFKNKKEHFLKELEINPNP